MSTSAHHRSGHRDARAVLIREFCAHPSWRRHPFLDGPRATLELGICARPGYQRYILYGTEGAIKLSGDAPREDEPLLQVRRKGGAGWDVIEGVEESNGFNREITLLLDSLDTGAPHPLNARAARPTHEVLMAIFESARRPGRVELPLDVTHSPLENLLKSRA